jgi:hypothetical protein
MDSKGFAVEVVNKGARVYLSIGSLPSQKRNGRKLIRIPIGATNDYFFDFHNVVVSDKERMT